MKPGVSLVGTNARNTIISAGDLNAIEGDVSGVTLENLTIDSNQYPVSILNIAATGSTVIKNSIIQSKNRGGIFIKNHDYKVQIYNCEITGRDGLVVISGTSGNSTLDIEVTNSSMTGNGPTPTTGEAAIFSYNAHRLTINNVKVRNLLENYQGSAG